MKEKGKKEGGGSRMGLWTHLFSGMGNDMSRGIAAAAAVAVAVAVRTREAVHVCDSPTSPGRVGGGVSQWDGGASGWVLLLFVWDAVNI